MRNIRVIVPYAPASAPTFCPLCWSIRAVPVVRCTQRLESLHMSRVLYLSRPWFPLLHRSAASPFGVFPQALDDAVVGFSKATWRSAGLAPREDSASGRFFF